MDTQIRIEKSNVVIFHIVTLFLILALLRLSPFNFFASIIVGHDVVIDNKEGNALNFINYISVILLGLVVLLKIPNLKTHWFSSWPFMILILIYGINAILAPYPDPFWVIYQMLFLLIGMVLHLLIGSMTSSQLYDHFNTGGFSKFFILVVAMILIVFLIMYGTLPLQYIIQDYNDAFVHSVNHIGIMKQYFGYISGFVLIYAMFIINKKWLKIFIICLVTLTSFGIRSFIIGLLAVLIFHNLKNFYRLGLLFFIVLMGLIFFGEDMVQNLIYDTRFYAYMNAIDIISNYPFGVGLGGYPIYTEKYNSALFASFFDINASLDYVPSSPESDVVHVFGSLGLISGILHFFLLLRLIVLGFFRRRRMNSFQLVMLYFFVFMTGFGISEDTMFTVSYWIFFGITSGLVDQAKQ